MGKTLTQQPRNTGVGHIGRWILWHCFLILCLPSVHAFERPSSCTEFYDPIYLLDESLVENEVVFRESGFDEPGVARFELTLSELQDNVFFAQDAHLIDSEEELSRRWLSQGIETLLTNAKSYAGLIAAEENSEEREEAKACMDEKMPGLTGVLAGLEDRQRELNQGRKQMFLMQSLNNAVLAEALLNYINELEEKHAEDLQSLTRCYISTLSSQSIIIAAQSPCLNVVEQQQQVTARFQRQTSGQVEALSALIKNHHLLFELNNDFELLDWYQSKVELSGFAQALLQKIPEETKQELAVAVRGEMSQSEVMLSYGRIRLHQRETFLASYQQLEADEPLSHRWRTDYESYLQRMYEAASFHCENDGRFMHYHEQLLDEFARDMRTGIQARRPDLDNTREFISLQAHQCRRWREDPYKKSRRWTPKSVIGTGLLGLGMVAAVVPGVGLVATGALVGSGTSLILWQTAQDHRVARNNLQNEHFSQLNSWSDLRGVVEEVDRIADVKSEYVLEAIFGLTGVSARVFGWAERIFHGARHFENLAARGSGTSVERANRLADLIDQRYLEDPANLDRQQSALTRWVQRLTGNHELPANLRRIQDDGSDFGTMIRTVSSRTGSPNLRDQAFDDLYEVMEGYDDHRKTLRGLIAKGENGRSKGEELEGYLSQLTPEHFRKNNPPPLPEYSLPGQRIERGANGEIYMVFNHLEDQGSTFASRPVPERFYDWDQVEAQKKIWQEDYQSIFTQNAVEEVAGLSKLSAEINAQALRYLVINSSRRMMNLASDGAQVTPTGRVHGIGLTDRQNLAMEHMDDLFAREDLLPRGDAFDNLMGDQARAEYWDLALGALRRRALRSKYVKEIGSGGGLLLRSLSLRFALLGGTTAALSTVGLERIAEKNRLLNRGYHQFQTAIRNGWREYYYFTDRTDTPYPYTAAERDCARESRGWTVENVCLFAEMRKELWEEIYRSRNEEGYDLRQDAQLDRKMREYLRRYLANRAHFQSGEYFLRFSEVLSGVSQEYTVQNSLESVREQLTELQGSGLQIALLLQEFLKTPEDLSQAKDIQQRLEQVESPETVLGLFEQLSELLRTAFPNAIQAPGSSPEVDALIGYLVEREKQAFE